MVKGQESKLQLVGDFEYSLVSDISDTDLRTYSIGLKGTKKNRSNKFGIGLQYDDYQFQYFGRSTGFEESNFQKFHTVQTMFFYKRSFFESWSVAAHISPTLSSNFVDVIDGEDFIPNADITISKTWKDENALLCFAIGAEYGTLFGIPRWYPTFSFNYNRNNNWTLMLGFPETRIRYSFNERHSLGARARPFGLYANNSDTVIYPGLGALANTKLRFNGNDFGLEHNYDMGTGFTTVVRAGFQQTSDLEVLDNGNRLIHDFEPDGTAYITMGLKYKLN
ncbi:hypothetical protein HME9304_01375 [Flagellimonas maritima]|uniref:DUF6268 domain-containing protein n=2 Tax=Flagellimonas maritima TaxID=1383885 RepID=A0A2Z4LR74_9FLAO|nr:hypothetical protein HME9304_01375 [Allomuricauda aurantiaca]